MKEIILYFIIAISFCGFLFNTKASAQVSVVSFQLISEANSKPITNKTIYIFNGDYEFRSSNPEFDHYPYDNSAKNSDCYLGITKTDVEGKFILNIKAIKARNIYFQAGSPYRIMEIEKSSDIGHSPSDSHIRIVRFEKGTTKVKYNDIYDLNTGILKRIWFGGKIVEMSFANITLIAQNE